MSIDTTKDIKPWFKQFYPWFLIALPLSVVIASIFTIRLAARHADDLVAEDYYKDGLAINRVIDQQRLAAQLNLSADASYDAKKGQVYLNLKGNFNDHQHNLRLSLVHATIAKLDTSVILRATNGNTFKGTLTRPNNGKWHLILEPENKTWRLDSVIHFPDQLKWHLTPKV
jgi:hypothetical protein